MSTPWYIDAYGNAMTGQTVGPTPVGSSALGYSIFSDAAWGFQQGKRILLYCDGSTYAFGNYGPSIDPKDNYSGRIILFQGNLAGSGNIALNAPSVGAWYGAQAHPTYGATGRSGTNAMTIADGVNAASKSFSVRFPPVGQLYASFGMQIPSGSKVPGTDTADTWVAGASTDINFKCVWPDRTYLSTDIGGGVGTDSYFPNLVALAGGANNAQVLFASNSGGISPSWYPTFSIGTDWIWTSYPWHLWEAYAGADTQGGQTGKLMCNLWADGTGRRRANLASGQYIFHTCNKPYFWNILNFFGYVHHCDTGIVYTDDVYLAIDPGYNHAALARVYVTNGPTLATSTLVAQQTPERFANQQIPLVLQNGPFDTSFTGATHIIVVKNDGSTEVAIPR